MVIKRILIYDYLKKQILQVGVIHIVIKKY